MAEAGVDTVELLVSDTAFVTVGAEAEEAAADTDFFAAGSNGFFKTDLLVRCNDCSFAGNFVRRRDAFEPFCVQP